MTTIVVQPFNVIKWQLKFNPVAEGLTAFADLAVKGLFDKGNMMFIKPPVHCIITCLAVALCWAVSSTPCGPNYGNTEWRKCYH